jgi:hypothetical protein
MGRLNKRYLGDPSAVNRQFTITAKLPSTDVGVGHILRDIGKNAFIVMVGSAVGVVRLVNTVTSGTLTNGQAFISATPHGGSPLAVKKVLQNKLVVWDTIDSATSELSVYKWSTVNSAVAGECTVLTDTVVNAKVTALGTVVITPSANDNVVASVTMTNNGGGYASAPVVTFSASAQTRALGTAVLTGDRVTSVIITNDGSYTDVELAAGITVSFAAP